MSVQFIKQLREEKKITQAELAASFGVSRPTYAQIEQGDRDLTITEAKRLADIFGISLNSFLEEKQPQISVKIIDTKEQSKKTTEDIRIEIPQQRVNKFEQVLLYILKKIGGAPNVGMTVLYKILYFIDFDYYEQYEEQLMGLAYIRNHYGPTPILFDDVIKRFMQQGKVELIRSKFYKYQQKKYLINPEVEPDLSVLDGREKEHIDKELQRLSCLTAKQLTDLSHKDVPWISAKQGEILEYEGVFYRTDETSVRNYNNNDD